MKNEFIKKMILKGMIEDLKEDFKKEVSGFKTIKKLNRKKENLSVEILENECKRVAYGCVQALNSRCYDEKLDNILTFKNDFLFQDLASIVKIKILEGLKNRTVVLLNNVFKFELSSFKNLSNELKKYIYHFQDDNARIKTVSYEELKENYNDFLEFILNVEKYQEKSTTKNFINYKVIQEKLKLTNKQIEILKLFLNGLNQSQVASITGYTRGDCYTAFSRVIKKFKKYYNIEA